MLTALDVCQPRPLRTALARLWVVYLGTGETTLVIAAASWLLEQLRNLHTSKAVPIQATAFIECARGVFSAFLKILQPMAQDCVFHLIKILQVSMAVPQSINYAVVASATQTLARLTATEAAFLDGKTVAELGHKIAIPALDLPHAIIRCAVLQVLVNLFKHHGLALGTITRKGLKSKVESLLLATAAAPPCREETAVAASLLALLISSDPTDSTRSVSAEKLVSSWVKLVDRLPPSQANEISSLILSRSPVLFSSPTRVFELLASEHALSFALVPESKKKYWRLSPEHFGILLQQLINSSPRGGATAAKIDLAGILRRLVKFEKVSSPELAVAIHCWYLRLAETAIIPLSAEEINGYCFNYIAPEVSHQAARALPLLVPSAEARLALCTSVFAQLKGEWNVSAASGVPPPFERLTLLALCLGSLIQATDPQSIYRTPELWQQICDWADDLHKAEGTRSIEWLLYGAIYGVAPGLLDLDRLGAELEARAPPPPSSITVDPVAGATASPAPFHLPLGELSFIRSVISSAPSGETETTTFAARAAHFIGALWRHCSHNPASLGVGSREFELLCQITLHLPPADGLIDVAASMSSRIICNFFNGPSFPQTLGHCQEIIVRYFGTASVASQKYHLSQFKIFVESSSVRGNIFATLYKLLPVVRIAGRSPDDAAFILETCKQLIFPFVCDRDPVLQRMASECLAKLVDLVGTVEFRDAMLQELIDRALNEQREGNRRGYILGIGQVFASLPESRAHFDISSVIGILSSLAKDPRSLIVQSSALDGLQKALGARRNPLTTVLSADTVYLVWQIYMSDFAALPIDSATEEILFDSLCGILQVLSEIIGPELAEGSTISRICRLMAAELLEDSTAGLSLRGTEDLLRATMQIITVSKPPGAQVNIPAIVSAIFCMLKNAGSADGRLRLGIRCLSWMLQFYFDETIQLVSEQFCRGLFQLGRSGCASLDRDIQTCQNLIFKQSFARDPLIWIRLLQDSRLLRPTGHCFTSSSVSLDQEVALLQSVSLETETMAVVETRETAAVAGELFPSPTSLESLESITLVANLILYHLDSGKDIPWSGQTTQRFIGDFIRLALAMTMLANSVREAHQLKLLGIRMISCLARSFKDVPDQMEQGSLLLDLYHSQMISVFSTAAQDQDLLVASESLASLIKLLLVPGLAPRLLVHPKVKSLVQKGVILATTPQTGDILYPCERVRAFCQFLLCEALLGLLSASVACGGDGSFNFDAAQRATVLGAAHRVFRTLVRHLLDDEGLVEREAGLVPRFLHLYLLHHDPEGSPPTLPQKYLHGGALALLLMAPLDGASTEAMVVLARHDGSLVSAYWQDWLAKVLDSDNVSVLTGFLRALPAFEAIVEDDWTMVIFEVLSKFLQLEVGQEDLLEAVKACRDCGALAPLLLFALLPTLGGEISPSQEGDEGKGAELMGSILARLEFQDEQPACALIFGPQNHQQPQWRVQCAIGCLKAAGDGWGQLLTQYATRELRQLFSDNAAQAERCFLQALGSDTPTAQQIALDCLDLALVRSLVQPAHLPPGPARKCILQLFPA